MSQDRFFSLEQVIDCQPLTVALETPLTEVISLMQEWGNSCSTNKIAPTAETFISTNNSCVLVVQNNRLEGIFTERDLVKLIAADFHRDVTVAEVMTSDDLVTLKLTDSTDVFTALNLLRQNHIRHLPIIDRHDNLIGLVTAKNLRQKLQPVNLMKWRKVAEIMENKVIHANSEATIRQIARLMANNRVSCVAIAEPILNSSSGSVRPVGIITERDLLQFKNLNLDLEQPASKVMSAPLFLVNAEDTLWSVQQQMQQRRVRRLLVGGAGGELAGIVTQTSLLKVFDSVEMYEVIKNLKSQVCQLELEKTRLLENRSLELEQKIVERTTDLESVDRRLKLETKLRRENERRFNSILNSLQDLVWAIAPNTFEVLYINPVVENIYGRPPREFYANSNLWFEVIHPEERERVEGFYRRLLAEGSQDIEYRIVRPDGSIRYLLDRFQVIYNSEGMPIRLDGITTDITQRKRREEILRDIAHGVSVEVGANFFSSLVEYLSKTLQVDYAMVCKVNELEANSIETIVVGGSEKTLDNFRYELAGTPCGNTVTQGLCIYPQKVRELFPNVPSLEKMAAESYAGMPILDTAGKVLGVIAVVHRQSIEDVSLVEEVLKIFANRVRAELERQQAEHKLREQAALLDIVNEAIMVCELDGQILFWNQGAEQLYGVAQAEALNKNATELLDRESTVKLAQIQQVVRKRGKWLGEIDRLTSAGQKIVVQSHWTLVKDEAGNPQSYLIVNTDITEQKQLEAQFLRAQRLESLGTLASGIAHDLNNIFSPILGFAKLLPDRLPNIDQQTRGFFQIMETNARRGTELVKQILTFARGLDGDRGTLQIRHIVAEVVQVIRETFPKNIEIKVNIANDLKTIEADATQIHQVLMNLVVNARDAMDRGGQLKITVENFPADSEFARMHLDAREGDYVLVTVADTGEGIPVVVLDRIFEPFFTTKEVEHGTGLGLSTAIGIVKSHGGFINVESEIGRGTKFQVFLPASEAVAAICPAETALPQGNGELILVVDDESSIRAVTKAILKTSNYRVLTAKDGLEAIAIYTQHQHDIDLVILDLMMPSMDGQTTIRILKQMNPSVKAIAISGLITSHQKSDRLEGEFTTFISKPYSTEELLTTVYRVVSG